MTEYAIKIGGSIWDGGYVGEKCRFDTYEEAQAAADEMRRQSELFRTEFNMLKLPKLPKCTYTVVEREVTPWRKAKKEKKL